MSQKILMPLNKTSTKMPIRSELGKTYIKRSPNCLFDEVDLKTKKLADVKRESPKFKHLKLARKQQKRTPRTIPRPQTTNSTRYQPQQIHNVNSSDSIIYLGTLYKFRGYSVTDTYPPIIDLTDSSSDINFKRSEFVLPERKGSSQSLVSSTRVSFNGSSSSVEQKEVFDAYRCNTCSEYLSHLSFSSEETLRIRKVASMTRLRNAEDLKAFDEKTELNEEDLSILDGILNTEEDYGDTSSCNQTNVSDSLEALDKRELVEDLNVNIPTLLDLYNVRKD